MLKGFRQFLLRGNVIDLAVAVVIGGAFGAVVTALVKDLITPLIAAIVGKPDFSAITFTINGSQFPVGDFINALRVVPADRRRRLLLRCRTGERVHGADEPGRSAAGSDDEEMHGVPERRAHRGAPLRRVHVRAGLERISILCSVNPWCLVPGAWSVLVSQVPGCRRFASRTRGRSPAHDD